VLSSVGEQIESIQHLRIGGERLTDEFSQRAAIETLRNRLKRAVQHLQQ